jgi:DNA-binding protein H-NS
MASRSLEEIERQIRALQTEAAELKVAEGIQQLRIVINKYGVGPAHFRIALGASKTRKRVLRKLPPKYRNPANGAQTWTGRGRKPHWLIDALDAGMTVEQCKVS